jgi:glycosyltransferase involved in cell wall biosynthesis
VAAAASPSPPQPLDWLGDGQITIDGRPLQGPSAVRGIGSYLRGLLQGFAELGVGPKLRLLLAEGAVPRETEKLGMHIARQRLRLFHPTLQPTLDLLLIARALHSEPSVLFHGVEWGQPLMARARTVVTVHDLIPFVFPSQYPWVRRARILPLRALRHADRVIAVSRSTARDVERIARVDPARISVVHEGISAAFQPAGAESVAWVRERFHITRPYVLAVGTFDPRKRIQLLAEVTRNLRRSHDVELVIAGDQGNFASRVQAAVDHAGVGQHTRITGHVSLRELVALYSGTDALLFTSAYEGFGLPPLEAMACAAPVVMFDNSSLPEVAGPAALLVHDRDAPAMAAAAATLVANDEERARRGVQGREWSSRYTWRASAEATIGVYGRALGA